MAAKATPLREIPPIKTSSSKILNFFPNLRFLSIDSNFLNIDVLPIEIFKLET
jgi:hypothetical protein